MLGSSTAILTIIIINVALTLTVCFSFTISDKENAESSTVWPRGIKQVGSIKSWDFCVDVTTLALLTSLNCRIYSFFLKNSISTEF